MKRLISCLLSITLLAGIMPAAGIGALAAESEPYSIDNGYIRVQVSKENGGFTVNTVNGDILKKSDNNKELLFHDDKYDTSFVSFRVEEAGGAVKDYIFGGKYGDSSDPSHKGVQVTQATENGDITAQWSVGNYTFTETITLANADANEHGMVSVALSAQSSQSSASKIKARVLLDTALGGKDYGVYQAVDEDSITRTITTEQILDGSQYPIPQNFYAVDDMYNTAVMAYSVNSPQAMPYQVAFGHWNNLAASLFDFAPDSAMDFTNTMNDYLTADSAYALYYDLGSVSSSSPASMISYYGVYSHNDVPAVDSFAIDAAVPLRLELNEEKTDFVRISNEGIADFSAGVTFENYESETAKDYSNIVLSVKTTGNLRPLGDMGAESGVEFASGTPFNITYTDVKVGDINSKTLYFEARPTDTAAYERITIAIYDVSGTDGALAEEKKLGEKIVYILLPGSDGNIPKVNFTSMTPKTVYTSGTRHLFITGENTTLLDNHGNWNLVAYSADGKTSYTINSDLITIKDGVMDVAIEDSVELAPGSWYLQLEWTDEAVQSGIVEEEYKTQTSSQLNFTVSEDVKYKNDSYGILTVVEYKENNSSVYKLKSFRNESDFETFKQAGGFEEILLIFRGEFVQEKYVMDGERVGTYYSAVSTKTLNQETREYEVDNCINVNGSMDFEGGTMAVYYEETDIPGGENGYANSPILVEFDGELLTSEARTSVWKGKAAFTKIEQGKSYSLIPYDKNGNRDENFTDETIKLIWPSIYGTGQTLAGLIFNMAYGELGVMKDNGAELGRVLSFSANLDLSFASPQADAAPKDTYWSKIKDFWKFYREDQSIYDYAYNSGSINRVFDWSNIDESTSDDKEISASVMVRDILFGCGQGFVGMNFKVDVGIQNYISSLPKITGKLEVNTINDWAFKFSGGMKLSSFSLEAKLSFKSRDDVPVPDEIYFYIGGFKPGINIDSCGVVWITGGGGGISNLYDTIFLSKAIPPLKLVMTVSFSIVQILDGKASLSVGLNGISLSGEDLKIFGVIEAIKKVYLGLEWYPGIDLQASISVNLFQGVIEGGGYIVLIGENYTDWFFEMYARAAIKIPESIPLVGGVTVANADLGISTEKIWGNIKVLFVGLGITYYWGSGSVDFGTGESKAKPTYPSLLGHEDVPVYYDAERDQTLYARIGTNVSEPYEAEVIDNSLVPKLMDAGLYSDGSLTLHKFNLGAYSEENSAAIVQISYDASSLDDAKKKAEAIKVNSSKDMSGTEYQLVLYNGENIDTANANITFDETAQKGAYSFTVTDQTAYNKDWYITTGGTKASVILYNVEPIPEIKTISGSINNGSLEVSWDGTLMDELDKVSFYLSESNEPAAEDGGILIEIVDNKDVLSSSSKKTTLQLPADVPTGDYYIRAVYSKEDEVNGVVYSTSKLSYKNENMPAEAEIESFVPAGNLEFGITVKETSDTNTTGYMATVYNEDGTATDAAGLTYDRASSGSTSFNIGGSYTGQDENGAEKAYGLTAGNKYKVGVTPYCLIDTDQNGELDTIIYGKEVFTDLKELPAMTTPSVTITADQEKHDITETVMADHDDDPDTPAQETTIIRETYTSNKIIFTAAISEASSGEWGIDGALTADDDGNRTGAYGTFSDTDSVSIPLEDLTEGGHTLTITGRDKQGDGFSFSYQFEVDTAPPRLMLSAPVNGSLFGIDGTLTVSGVTDSDARFTIISDGTELCSGKTIKELGGSISSDGVFSFDVQIFDPNGASSREIVISASDDAGNIVTKHVEVTHGGMANLKKVQILVDGNIVSNGNIPVVYTGQSVRQLSLAGITDSGIMFKLTSPNVSWECQAVEGKASVDTEGKLTAQSYSQGMATGRLEVSKGAYMTDTILFGADSSENLVAVTSSIGGKVIGGGNYMPNQPVELTAVADEGYVFSGWTLTGVSVSDASQPVISFTMPEGTVTAHAEFKAEQIDPPPTPVPTDTPTDVPTDTPTAAPSETPDATSKPRPAAGGGGGSGVIATARPTATETPQTTETPAPSTPAEEHSSGEVVKIKLPDGVNENAYIPYYLDENEERVYVALSDVIDGYVVFIAPVDAQYYLTENYVEFDDVKDHWAEDYIDFTAAREIFRGVDDNLFGTEDTMTRAMFVTVLYRIAGEPEFEGNSAFTDIEKGSWYEKAVAWGSGNGIVKGIDDEHFAPDAPVTREQMCALIARYISSENFEIASKTEAKTFIDSDSIGEWAEEDVTYCQTRGFIDGYPDGSFGPQNNATRAENSKVIATMIKAIVELAAE